MPNDPTGQESDRPGGGQAVCFTAGAAGAVFAIGTIHAWLAADRRTPEVAAGISVGALSAAAMQQCFRQLEAARADVHSTLEAIEAARWEWFRKYVNALSDSPLDVIWRALPDPIDLFADKPPVVDLSCPLVLRQADKEARRHYYRLTRLGVWFGGLPVKVSSAASLIVDLVRWREGYGGLLVFAAVAWHAARIGWQLLWHTVKNPLFIWHGQFRSPHESIFTAENLRVRPLLGWKAWLNAMVLLISAPLAFLAATALAFQVAVYRSAAEPAKLGILGAVVLLAAIPLLLLARAIRALTRDDAADGSKESIVAGLLSALEIEQGLLRDYHLRRMLLSLFGEYENDSREVADVEIADEAPKLVIVAAPLESVKSRSPGITDLKYEVFAARGRVTLVEALRTAMTVPGLFPPVEAEPEQWGITATEVQWASPDSVRRLHLVDGSTFRQTPLPSLLSWMGYHPDAKSGRRIEQAHIIYSVPIEPKPVPEKREKVNIFEAASESIRLAKRRDTRQQAHQVRFVSNLERLMPQSEAKAGRPFALDITEIAPADDISFENTIDPTRDEALTHAAEGCRRTLEALYGPERLAQGEVAASCSSLLLSIAPLREPWIKESPGLPEVCSHCTQLLKFSDEACPQGGSEKVLATFGSVEEPERVRLLPNFEALDGVRPSVTVLASGGAFRGVTYIGFIAALIATNIKPDLVVGASVGALTGAALCAITEMLRRDQPKEARTRLRELVDLFENVDKTIALTETWKNALKQIGVRARRIHLSPSKVRLLIRNGAGLDAGFAATGAPPELIDAISELFLIPHQATSAIAAEFVSGHFAAAVKHLWDQLQKETLPKLHIETALMGSSLLEQQVRAILRPPGAVKKWDRQVQPYGDTKFFCTASDLNRRALMLLGRDFLRPTESYDFVEACLSSSAFPAIFAPRKESQVLPGRGRTDVLLFDGGMFDNLPFLPAMEVIGRVQRERLAGATMEEALADLESRHANPHVLIAVSLTASPETYDDDQANLSQIRSQTLKRKAHVKIMEFENSSRSVRRQVGMLLHATKEGSAACDSSSAVEFLNNIVVTETLRVMPSDRHHINGTFAFCKTLGLNKEKLDKTIADGCFQTLNTLSARKLNGLPAIERVASRPRAANCPFFAMDGADLLCPFASDASTSSIRTMCIEDEVHQRN